MIDVLITVAFISNVESFLLTFLRLFNLSPSSDISESCLNLIFSFKETSITDKE